MNDGCQIILFDNPWFVFSPSLWRKSHSCLDFARGQKNEISLAKFHWFFTHENLGLSRENISSWIIQRTRLDSHLVYSLIFIHFKKGSKFYVMMKTEDIYWSFLPLFFFLNFKVNGFSNSRHDMERTGIMLKTENEPMRR